MSKWELVMLQDICEKITDGTHLTPRYVDKGFIFLSSKNVTSKYIDWENVKYIPEELHYKLSKRLKPQKGDILLAKNGTTGVAALVDKDEIFDIYVSLALLRPKQGVYAPYLLNVINSPFTKRQFNKSLKGIGVPNLHLKEIKNVVVPLPPLNIQKHIADTLEKTQEIIDGHKKQLQELDNLIKATFYEMFGDIKKNDKKWNQFKIGDVCIEQIQSLKSNEVVDITYIDISSISNTKKEIINFQKLNSSKAPSRAKQVLEFNDILVSTVRPNLNAVAINNIITDRKIIGSTGYCVLRCSNSINYKFLFEITKSCYLSMN